MNKIENLKQELNKDLKVDHDNIVVESLRIPALHGKWLQFAMDAHAKSVMLQSQLKKLHLKKWNFYLGRGTAAEYKEKPFHLKILKSEVYKYVEADTEIRELEDKLALQKVLVDFLDGAIKAIAAKNWNIKNAIEYMKFQQGIV